jgi:hypothetical protein
MEKGMDIFDTEPFDVESSQLVKSIQCDSNRTQIVEQFPDYLQYEESIGPE